MIYLDTHVAIFIYAGNTQPFTKKGLSIIQKETLVLPAMAELELQYLHEIGRLQVSAGVLVADLQERVELQRCELKCCDIVSQAQKLSWTRDPFDRMIVASAMVQHADLLTKDHMILEHYRQAIW